MPPGQMAYSVCIISFVETGTVFSKLEQLSSVKLRIRPLPRSVGLFLFRYSEGDVGLRWGACPAGQREV